MKPTPHDPLDDLIAAALHGDLTPEERAQFESRLSTDPSAQAVYQEAQAMHDLLEQTNRSAQPDPDFEQRMVSGVRRKIAHPPHQETAWESLTVLWRASTGVFDPAARALGGYSLWAYGGICSAVLAVFFLFVIRQGNQVQSVFTTITSQLAVASAGEGDERQRDLKKVIQRQGINYVESAQKGVTLSGYVDTSYTQQFGGAPSGFGGLTRAGSGTLRLAGGNTHSGGSTVINSGTMAGTADELTSGTTGSVDTTTSAVAFNNAAPADLNLQQEATLQNKVDAIATASAAKTLAEPDAAAPDAPSTVPAQDATDADKSKEQSRLGDIPVAGRMFDELQSKNQKIFGIPAPAGADTAAVSTKPASAPADTRKLIRNAQLDLEVKSFQSTFDSVSALTKSAGGYVDTSNSQRGGNGKLQGTVVVKILPENLDAFLLKLRDLGDVQNQSVSTDDVTKDYFDTQARLVNSQKMEEQLQDLLKRENGKVSDLLAVERELGRVRGDIEGMQGQLKLYDFQVQYATVTMNIAEKDLNQAAAYLLKENDNFSLFATDVESAFQKARAAADQYNAQVLAANLEHDVNSDNNQVAASLVVMVAPDQIEPFLTQVRGLGRVANFTRQTERVAKDGGDSSQPADETKTEKDKVRVQLSIRSDDDSRKQVAITVVAKDVSDALDQAKAAALANVGTEILNASLNATPQGSSTGQISVRVPGKEYTTLMDSFRALGRQASLSVQRNDNNGPGANGDDVPVIVTLALTDNDAPVQETNLTIAADDVDAQAQQIKKQATDASVEIKSSSFQRQPDGTEEAQMTLRMPLGSYPAFLATLQKAGKTESLSVQRDDRPDQARPDSAAPAEIQLDIHNVAAIVPDNNGLWATLRGTFSQGFGALFGSVRVIGVIIAFLVPWLITIVLCAWIGRRIYVWRRNR